MWQLSVQVVSHFEPAGAAALLEEEIREALVGTAGTAAGKPAQQHHHSCLPPASSLCLFCSIWTCCDLNFVQSTGFATCMQCTSWLLG